MDARFAIDCSTNITSVFFPAYIAVFSKSFSLESWKTSLFFALITTSDKPSTKGLRIIKTSLSIETSNCCSKISNPSAKKTSEILSLSISNENSSPIGAFLINP